MSRDPRDRADVDDFDDRDDVRSPAAREAERRRRKSLITLGVILLGLFFAFWWAYSYYRASSEPNRPSGSATCRTLAPDEVTPAKVTLNVYNATKRTGLAASAAKEFTAQGYAVAAVANDPAGRAVAGPAEVRFGPAGKAGADLVLASIGEGAVPVDDQRQNATVDVALGETFVKLVPLPESSPPVCPAPSTSASASASPSAS